MKKYLIVRAEVQSLMFGEGGRKFYITPLPVDKEGLDAATRKIERLAHRWAKGVKGYVRDELAIENWAECELVEVEKN